MSSLHVTKMPDSPARQFAYAAIGFLLPLAIFFGWFFLFRALNFAWVLAALLLLIIGFAGGRRALQRVARTENRRDVADGRLSGRAVLGVAN